MQETAHKPPIKVLPTGMIVEWDGHNWLPAAIEKNGGELSRTDTVKVDGTVSRTDTAVINPLPAQTVEQAREKVSVAWLELLESAIQSARSFVVVISLVSGVALVWVIWNVAAAMNAQAATAAQGATTAISEVGYFAVWVFGIVIVGLLLMFVPRLFRRVEEDEPVQREPVRTKQGIEVNIIQGAHGSAQDLTNQR